MGLTELSVILGRPICGVNINRWSANASLFQASLGQSYYLTFFSFKKKFQTEYNSSDNKTQRVGKVAVGYEITRQQFFTMAQPPNPTNPFTIFELHYPEMDKLNVVRKLRSKDFEALKLWQGPSGIRRLASLTCITSVDLWSSEIVKKMVGNPDSGRFKFITRPSFSQFYRFKISRLTKFMNFRSVDLRISRLSNCEMVGRDWSEIYSPLMDFWLIVP